MTTGDLRDVEALGHSFAGRKNSTRDMCQLMLKRWINDLEMRISL